MTTTENVTQVKLNVMTEAQYSSATKNTNELYMVTDAKLPASDISGLATVATSGAYSDLTGTPTIPTVNNATLTITQGGTTKGTFTANASGDVTIALDAGGASILEALYPVGSVYITTANTCPLSTLISGSTWELVSSGRVLQGADSGHSAGTTIEAGLPNITGDFKTTQWADINSGAFIRDYTAGNFVAQGSNYPDVGVNFDASRSSSIYGNSSTVQPPAYCVNIWKRTA